MGLINHFYPEKSYCLPCLKNQAIPPTVGKKLGAISPCQLGACPPLLRLYYIGCIFITLIFCLNLAILTNALLVELLATILFDSLYGL